MFRIAFGQSKMLDKPIVGVLHLVVYLGFLIINIELLEILVDGFLGTHRVFAPFLGSLYNFLIAFFEIFAILDTKFETLLECNFGFCNLVILTAFKNLIKNFVLIFFLPLFR